VDRFYSIPPVDGAPGWRLIQSFDGIKLYERAVGVNQ